MITDLVLALALVTLIILGTRVFAYAGASRAALSFAVYCFTAAFIAIIEIATHYAPTYAVARHWGQVGALWPLAWVFFASFTVRSAGLGGRGRLLVMVPVVLAAVVIGGNYFLLARDGVVVAKAIDFGYVLESPSLTTPGAIVAAVSYSLIIAITITVLARAAMKSDMQSRRRQMRWILLAYSLSFVVGIGLVLLREVGGLEIREVNGFSYLATAVTIYLGIVRKHMIDLSPELVARQALDQIEEWFVLTDERYRIASVNAAASRMLGTTRRELVGRDIRECLCVDADAMDGGEVEVSLEGTQKILHLSQSVTKNHLDEIVGRVIVAHDVTIARKREARLQGLVSEKTLLVQELHHRVRNTIQLISAIVSLKARSLEDREAIDVIEEISGRIDLIALAYNNIYDQAALDQIPLDGVLRELSDRLAMTSTGQAAMMGLDLEPFAISAEQAIPVLLAVAELVTNAIQHAYPAGTPGPVRIMSRRASATEWTITVSDDGTGVSAEVPAGAVGLVLAHELARQIDGALVRERSSAGTTWVLTMPIKCPPRPEAAN